MEATQEREMAQDARSEAETGMGGEVRLTPQSWLLAREQAARLLTTRSGERLFLRFSTAERVEHMVLIGCFAALGLTGLLQRTVHHPQAAAEINALFGGLETVRGAHRAAALIFVLLCAAHLGRVLSRIYVTRRAGAMMLTGQDARDLATTLAHVFGRSETRPFYDRFSVFEKLEYWGLLLGSLIMGLTGVVLWSPTLAANHLPGELLPVARAVHGLQAILMVVTFFVWHLYQVAGKTRNSSIFTGVMSDEQMAANHPLDRRRILASAALIDRLESHSSVGRDAPSVVDRPDGHSVLGAGSAIQVDSLGSRDVPDPAASGQHHPLQRGPNVA